MKVKQLIEVKYAYKWEPELLTKQWFKMVDPNVNWEPEQLQDYQRYYLWVVNHEKELNEVYQSIVDCWEETVAVNIPRFPSDEYNTWDLRKDFNPHECYRENKAYRDLHNADDFRDDWFEEALEGMLQVILT